MDIEAPESLLEYDAPIALGEGETVKKVREASKTGAGSAETKAPSSQLDEILHAVLPPREFVDEGNKSRCMQYVSNKPSTRIDVIKMQEKLDDKLMARQARESGICPVREDLYTQCFDELIRQVRTTSSEFLLY